MKIAIYTCITGNYDSILQPLYVEDGCDYYLITDNVPRDLGSYKWIDVSEAVPQIDMPPKDKNRYCKLHPFELFSGYEYSIYLDGSIQIINGIAKYIGKTGNVGLGMHRHRKSKDIYTEGIFLSWLGAVDKQKLIADMERYVDEGFPKDFGQFECGMIVTDLHNSKAHDIYLKWYEEYLKSSRRDQQSLVYVLWKMGYTAEDIGDLGGEYNIGTNPDIHWFRGTHYK